MSFSHREEKRDGRLLDILADDETGLCLIVSRLGAELVSLARRASSGEWIGFLYRDNDISAPARGWANHATVMGYFLHRLKNAGACIAISRSKAARMVFCGAKIGPGRFRRGERSSDVPDDGG